MKLTSNKNIIILLAALLVVAFAFMALVLLPKKRVSVPKKQTRTGYEQEIDQIETQSTSDTVESIEADLGETDLSDLDRELQDIENELNLDY